MTAQDVATLLSVALTVPTLIIAGYVIRIWFLSAAESAVKRKRYEPIDWLLLGIVLSFFGQILDNLYWLFPWTCSFLGLHISDTLIENGVYFDVFTRQLRGIAAGFCYVHAFYLERRSTAHKARRIVLVSCALGVVYAIALVVIRALM